MTTPMTPDGQNVQWKSSWRDANLKWICGFANAQGGILEIGRNDCGEVVGVGNVHRLCEKIPGKVRSLLGILVEVNVRSECGLEYLQIVVEPQSRPISYLGKFHYRTGTTKQVLEGAAATRLLEPENRQKTTRKQPEGVGSGQSLADRIVTFLRENPSAGRRRIVESLEGTTEGSVRYQLDKLKESNRLRRVGPDRGGRWMVLDGDGAVGGSESKARAGGRRDPGDGALFQNRQKTARNGGQPPENHQKPAGTPRKQPESLPLPDRILAVLRQHPSTSRRELAAALGTTQSTVRYRLDKLRAAGRIERVGPDKGGRWKVLPVPHTEADPSR